MTQITPLDPAMSVLTTVASLTVLVRIPDGDIGCLFEADN